VAEIARAEGMDVTQGSWLLRLTLLAPEVLERLTESPEAALEHVMRGGYVFRANVTAGASKGRLRGLQSR
jgi:predicted Rdx family selenoprotein